MRMQKLLPWILGGGVVAAIAYEASKNTAAPATPAKPVGPVPILGTPGILTGVPAPTPAPAAPAPVAPAPVGALPADVSTTIATLLDSRIRAEPALLEQFAVLADAANPGAAAKLRHKAILTRLAVFSKGKG